MTIIGAFACGTIDSAALWLVARRVGRERSLPLGTLPPWLPALCGLAAMFAVEIYPPGTGLAAASALVGAIVCALVDARTGYIFDAVSLTVAVTAAIASAALGHIADGSSAALAIGGALAVLYFGTGRRGIGLGDVKLGAAVGLGLGLQTGIVAIGSAFVLGALYAIAMMASGRLDRSDSVRFGPFIAGGSAVGVGTVALGWSW